MLGKKQKTKVMMPAAFMALAGMMVGAGFGPIALSGSVGGALDTEASSSSGTDQLKPVVEALLAAELDAGVGCPYEDQSGGWGGQSGSCTFDCPAPAGTFTLEVHADDPDATVSGSGSCGVHDVHCSDQQSCSESGYYDGSQGGSCSGDSDEFYDSGLYVNCYANAEDKNTGSGPTEPGVECPIQEPILVCYDPDDLPPALSAIIGLCARLDCSISASGLEIQDASGQDGAHLFARDGRAAGAICDDGECQLVVPTLTFVDGRQHVTI